MKIIYIAGLEHSGSTLTDHLLSGHPGVLGLGEIASFFSPSHMKHYMNQWGKCTDASLCSCGKDWSECEFWGGVVDLNGLNSDESMTNRYNKLLSYIRKTHGDETIVVDSSKSIDGLAILIENAGTLGISPTDILVILTIKDVRSFSASIMNKHDSKKSLISVVRSFNYWLGSNKRMLDYIKASNVNFSINLYEELCADPSGFINKQLARVGRMTQTGEIDIKKNTSHIAMGNKDFVMRNRERIKYDSRWYHDDLINFIYLFHRKARAFNKYIYALQRATGAQSMHPAAAPKARTADAQR